MAKIEYDPEKNRINRAEHGLDFASFAGFDAVPLEIIDDRTDYGEVRIRSFGRIAGVGHMIAYTVRGARMRLISFRRAHEKEMKRYGR